MTEDEKISTFSERTRLGTWPRCSYERTRPKPLSEEERLRENATKRADFLIRQLGPSAEVLELQNLELTGLTLRETLIEKEYEKMKAELELKKARQRADEDARQERMAQAEKEVLDGWNDTYILTVGGQRIKKTPKDLSKLGCPFCGAPHVRLRGALLELWEWRNNHTGPGASTYEAPIRSESLVCSKCGQAFAYRAQVII